MERTRKSLFYVAFYLLQGGIAFGAMPQTALAMFGAVGTYSDALVRFVGVLLLTLGIIVVQLVRLRAERMYTATLAARTVILPGMLLLYAAYDEPLMLVLCGIVGLGYALTWVCYLLDRRQRARDPLYAAA